MAPTSSPITADELFALGDRGPCELIEGELVNRSYAGAMRAACGARLAHDLDHWNDRQREGHVFAAGVGYWLTREPDSVRTCDASYVRNDRLGGRVPRGYLQVAPDLAAEIIESFDTWPEVEAKVDMWLSHGCRSCWIVDIRNRRVVIRRQDGSTTRLNASQDLEDPVLPGFKVAVASLSPSEWSE